MSSVIVCAVLLAAVVVRIYAGVLVARELEQNPALRRRVRHAFVASV